MSLRLRAVGERRRQERRLAYVVAWHTAHWTACRSHGIDVSGELAELLGDDGPAKGRPPEQVWNDVMNWAIQTRGCRIETHDTPVM